MENEEDSSSTEYLEHRKDPKDDTTNDVDES